MAGPAGRDSARRRVEERIARALSRLPKRAQRALSGGRPVTIDGQELHHEVQLLLALSERAGMLPFETFPVEEARLELDARARAFGGPPVEVERVEERSLPGPAGPIAARLYRPDGARDPALLVYFHGGGHTIGSLDSCDGVCRRLAAGSGAAVLSVDYRMGPEDRFPAAVEDAVAAFDHAVAEAGSLGIDPTRIAVGGDSAGGNLAAVACQQRRAADGPTPAFQLLIYPVCDLSSERSSRKLFDQRFLLTRTQIDWYRERYLPEGEPVGGEVSRDPRVSPLLADDLSGLPPAYVVTAGFDPLRDEGEEYAHALTAAGGTAVVRRHPGQIHGFVNLAGFGRNAREAVAEMAGALRLGLAPR
jgi:acetyl esterase